MKIQIVKPENQSPDDLQEFADFVAAGGQVISTGLPRRVSNALILGKVYTDEDKLVGSVAIKRPEDSYRQRVFTNAGVADLLASGYLYEFGWLSVLPEYRGRVTIELVNTVLNLSAVPSIYAVIASHKHGLIEIAHRYGFRSVGHEFYGKDDNLLTLLAKG